MLFWHGALNCYATATFDTTQPFYHKINPQNHTSVLFSIRTSQPDPPTLPFMKMRTHYKLTSLCGRHTELSLLDTTVLPGIDYISMIHDKKKKSFFPDKTLTERKRGKQKITSPLAHHIYIACRMRFVTTNNSF